jgi:glucose-1-phosphate thymidylyltransferase
MKCLILAGGFGTRLYPLTIYKAKALLEYKGKPLLSHILDRVPENIDILVSCNRKFESDFHRWQKNADRPVELCVEHVWTEEQKKGAIGSLEFWVGSKNITEDLLVIAGDNYFEFDLAEFIFAYDGENVLVAIYDIGDMSKASQFGIVSLDGNRIVEFQEKPAQPHSSLVSTGIYIFPPRIFPLLSRYCAEGKRDNLGSFITHLIDRDEVHARVFTETWLDIGSAEDLTHT